MRNNSIKTACMIGLLAWSAGTFAEEASTSIIEVGEPAPQLMPRYGTTASDITFENHGQTLRGTLTEPQMTAPYPIVVMLHGFSGDRDGFSQPVQGTEETMYGRTARVFAEHGIASLRIDFRGSGNSDGNFSDMTFTRQISDTLAAIEYAANLPQIDSERMGLLGRSQGGLVGASAAARDDRIDSLVLWVPVSIPYATYRDAYGPETIEAGLNAADGELVESTAITGATFELKRPFFEELLKIDPVAEIVPFTKPLMVVVGLQDTIIKPQPQMGEIYLRYHEGEEALVILDADHFLNVREQSADLDKAIAWSLDWFDKAFTEQEHYEEPEESEEFEESEGSEESEGFFDASGFDSEGFCEEYPDWEICD